MFRRFSPVMLFLIGVFYCVPAQAEEFIYEPLPESVEGCITTLKESYTAAAGRMAYQTYVDRYRACYIDNDQFDLLPTTMREPVVVSPLADCLLSAQRSNGGSLGEFKEAGRACYEKHSLGGVWDTPELKQVLLQQFDSLRTLSPEQAQSLNNCLGSLQLTGIPNADTQRALAGCFQAVGQTSTAQLYGSVATVIDCAEEVSKVKGNLLNTMQLSNDQQSSLEQCVVTRLAPVTLGVSAVAIPLLAGWHGVVALVQLMFTQVLLFFRRKPAAVGRVFDVTTHEPVDLSIVRLLDANKRILKTSVTDRTGEYFFLPPPGTYVVEVVKPNYIFPSQLGVALSKATHYFGESLSIQAASDTIAKHVPIDPAEPKAQVGAYKLQLWRNRIVTGLAVLGPIMSLITVLFLPRVSTALIAVVHVLLFAFFWRVTARPKRQYGVVRDAKGRAVPGVAVSLIETKFNRRIHYTLTDVFGRYYIPSVIGSYMLHFSKPGLAARSVALLSPEGGATTNQHQTVELAVEGVITSGK